MTSYDLLLQPRQPGGAFELEVVLAALELRGLVRRGEGGVLKLGLQELEVRPLREAGAAVGVELKVPLSSQTALLEEAVGWAVGAAQVLELRVIDPQLGSTLTSVSASVVDEFLRAARYAGEFAGVPDAVAVSSLAEHHEGSGVASRLLLAAVVFLFVLWGTFRIVGELRSSRPAAAAPRSP